MLRPRARHVMMVLCLVSLSGLVGCLDRSAEVVGGAAQELEELRTCALNPSPPRVEDPRYLGVDEEGGFIVALNVTNTACVRIAFAPSDFDVASNAGANARLHTPPFALAPGESRDIELVVAPVGEVVPSAFVDFFELTSTGPRLTRAILVDVDGVVNVDAPAFGIVPVPARATVRIVPGDPFDIFVEDAALSWPIAP